MGNNTAGGANGGFGSSKLEGEGASIVSAGRDSMVNIWSSSGDCLSSQAAHRGTVSFLSDINYPGVSGGYSYAYSALSGLNTKSCYNSLICSSPMMLSLGTDGVIKVWDMRRYKCISEVGPSPQAGNCTKAVWCSQGFLTGSNTGVVRLYEHTASLEPGSTLGTARDITTAGYGGDSADYVGRTGSGSPGAVPYISSLATIPASPQEWAVRDLAVHGAGATGAGGAASAGAGASSACTDLICTEAMCASASKSGQILRWSR
jgi:hypothetical protein